MAKLVAYLRDSLRLQSPDIETDPAYKFTDAQLSEILERAIPAHDANYTLSNFPQNEENFLVLLAKKELYYRLATSTAPLYPLSAEGAELRKDVRFDHYMSLIRRVEIEYSSEWNKFDSSREVESHNVFLDRNHLTVYNYENANKPKVTLTAVNVRDTSIDLAWDKFEVERGKFYSYTLYIGTSPIYDDFTEEISSDAVKEVTIFDIHRTKHRISYLLPNTTYYVAVVSQDLNKLQGVCQITVTTLSQGV